MPRVLLLILLIYSLGLSNIYKETKLSILEHEGFMSGVYRDSLGYLTIGHGINIEKQGIPIELSNRWVDIILYKNNRILSSGKYATIYTNLDYRAKKVILEMSYQLGVQGVYSFRKVWRYLKNGDYTKASMEMVKSKWARQTSKRAYTLAIRMAQIN